MKPFSDRMILAFLGGALDPPLAQRLASELPSDPMLAARVEALRARLREPTEAPRWRLPPPGLPIGLHARLSREADMAQSALRPGDLIAARLQLDEAEPRLVVVLRRGPAGWEVLTPTAPEERTLLTDLAFDAQGGRILHLTVASEPPIQRWAVALPLASGLLDWTAPPERRWAGLHEALERGDVPVVVVEARVGEPYP